VEFALTELWAHEKGVRLTHSGYEALGGVAGALSAHAEERLGEVVATHGEAPVRRLFTQLARPDDAGGFTRKPVRLAPLPPELRSAAEALATRTRFVRITHGPDDDPIADLAHEELVRAWDRLRRWLEDSRDFRAWQERLSQAMAHWKETGEEPGALLRGTMLATSLERLADPGHRADITQEERAYVEAGRRHQQRALRRWRAATGVVVVLALLAGFLAVRTWRGEVALEEQVRTMASRRLVEHVLRLAGTDPGMAARLSLAAWHNHPGKEARQALFQVRLGAMSVVFGQAGQGSEPVRSIDMTPDGSTVVTTSAGRDGAAHARVWWGLGERRASWWQVPGLTGGAPLHAELSDDGGLLAVVTADGTLHCYDVRSRAPLWTSPPPVLGTEHKPETVALDFSDSGRLLLRLAADGLSDKETAGSSHVQVWHGRTGQAAQASQRGLPSGPEAVDAALVGEGEEVVSLSRYGEVAEARVRDRVTGGDRRRIADAAWLSHKGAGVVVDQGNGRRRLIRLTGTPGTPGGGGRRFLAVSSDNADLTGRYAVARATTQVSQYEVVEPGTGRLYHVPGVPSADPRQEPLPVGVLPGEEDGAAPRVLVAAGSDLLLLRTREERAVPLPEISRFGGGQDATYLRSPRGEYRARVDNFGGDDEATTYVLVARRGEESRAEPVRLTEFGEEDSAEGFFTSDGGRLVLWGADKISVFDPDTPHKRDVRSFPDLLDVLPLQGSEVVIRTLDRLIRYDVAADKALDHYACDALTDPCAGIAVRPGGRAEVAVGHSSGEVVIWDAESGRVRRKTGITADAGEMVFGPRGRTVATALEGGAVQRWDVDTGERVGPAVEPGAPAWLVTLADDGTLLTRGAGENGLALWRSADANEPYLTLPFTAEPEDLRLTADHLTVQQANSRLTIPLDPETWHRALCRHWTPYTPEELRILADAGAVTDSPCP
jgi:WD40 repeat protein